MKKVLFTTIFCFLVSISFAQKKAVKEANNEIKGTVPNIAEARNLIKGALTNPETAELAETWYVAGSIENKQFDMEKVKEIVGQQPNEAVMYPALEAILPYFEKAIVFDQLPDEKGKVKPKYIKDIKLVMKANRPYYSNAGLYYYNKKDYKKAYENFKLYGDITKMDIFKDDKEKWVLVDSIESQVRFYAGLMAASIPNHEAAIEIFEEMKNAGYNEDEVYRSLANEYNVIKDTLSFEKAIGEGFKKFPDTPDNFYLLHMINISISNGKAQEAINYLDAAIAKDANKAQLYDVLGQVYENEKKDDKAIENLKKAVELEPENVDINSHIGRVYFNLGHTTRAIADEIKDIEQSKVELKKSKDYFRSALPYFELVYSKDSDNRDAIRALYTIYYNLDMGPEFDKIEPVYKAKFNIQEN
jgi:tetratricopeptide (TPR) repeat protein